jgi:hypothetical protein
VGSGRRVERGRGRVFRPGERTWETVDGERAAMQKTEANRKYLDEVLRLIRAEYYGRVTLSLEGGQIVFLKKEQTIKLKN